MRVDYKHGFISEEIPKTIINMDIDKMFWKFKNRIETRIIKRF